jgi:hypothetical protein
MKNHSAPKAVYVTPEQQRVLQSPAKVVVAIMGRGSGKTSLFGLMAYQFVQELPRSKGFLVGLTYKQIINNFLPQMIEVWASLGLVEDVHFVIGKKPPPSFRSPYKPAKNYENTVTFFNGTTIILISMDRKDLARGGSFDWGLFDEAVLLNQERVSKEIIPMIRGNEHRYSSHLHQRLGFVSSQAWTPSGAWVPDMKHRVDPNDPTRLFYIEGTARTNAAVGGQKYMDRMRDELPKLVYDVEVENVRVEMAPECFYEALDMNRHCYFDSYDYTYSDAMRLTTSNKDYDPTLPMSISLDFGASFSCLTVHQLHGNEDRTINALWKKRDTLGSNDRPLLTQLMEIFIAEYKGHKGILEVWGDRNGNNKQVNAADSLYGEVRSQLTAAGFIVVQKVHPGELDQAHLVKHFVLNKLLAETEKHAPKVRINQNRCKALLLSLQGAAVTLEGKKDKSNEDPRKGVPAENATHLSDCFDNYYGKKYSYLFQGIGSADVW